MDEFEWVQSFATSSYGTISDIDTPLELRENLAATTSRGSFASFVCHVSNLEKKLRSFSNIVLDGSSDIRITGKILGQGKTFMVKHAQWVQKPNEPPIDVALKEIIPDAHSMEGSSSYHSSSNHGLHSDWKDILFEIRALLHEPIRYHPNLVRLLGIQWGLSPISDSTYPILIMEYASMGTLNTLQSTSEPLSFAVKQKLCYDVSRGLSALHASGIVHGDLKHENVLIFPSKKAVEGLPYTAKLADFGGSVMDLTSEEFRQMETWTWPFQAPEISTNQTLGRSGMMLTDTYSFGLLVWRAFMDGVGFVSLDGAAQNASDQDKRSLSAQKSSEKFTSTAIIAFYEYAIEHGLPQSCIDLVGYVQLKTIRLRPEDRSLVKAQAALRGIKPGHIPAYLEFIRKKNDERETTETEGAPGRHGITRDSLAFMLGRYGEDADLQDNLPGYRPRLDEPNAEDFLFEPESLKNILTWDQQRQMLVELKNAASRTGSSVNGLLDMKKTVAAFYVFQCYLLEFGTLFDAEEAIQWLVKASADDDSHEDADYLAQAWLWRISRSLDVNVAIDPSRLTSLLRLSVMRGHRTCSQDILQLGARNSPPGAQEWFDLYHQARYFLQTQMGAVGMGYFFSSFLAQPWKSIDIDSITQLDNCIRAVIRNDYAACLRPQNHQFPDSTGRDRESTAFDKVYVNGRGHGLLHWASARGAVAALRHMITKYKCNIDLPNQHVDETPLLCACAGGNLECVRLLIANGADPNGYRHSQESPLHWLCSFEPSEMGAVAESLVAAGADVEMRSGGMRHDVRGIRADWEHIFEVRTTPLGRAVLMNNLGAVKVLLKLGANPLTKTANRHRGEWEGMENMAKMVDVSSPFDIAAILLLPDILAEFIHHIDRQNVGPIIRLLDEASMLSLAHEKTVVGFDPLSLQSRLVRSGARYKTDLRTTLKVLHNRALLFHGTPSDAIKLERSKVLCKEVALGNIDIVEGLLDLNYSSDGTTDHRPLLKAVQLNHQAMFKLLIRHDANPKIMQMTPKGSISLLHVCASRGRHSPSGRAIADALLAAGVPVESADPRTKSPFALAILNQNFDVASALLQNGANIDATYPLTTNGLDGPETKKVSVLVEVLSQHTMRSLGSLRFLLGQRADGTLQRPAFHVDPANRLSILHQLAGSPQFTQIAQITPKILNLCLETYNDTDLINYRHPILGTALYVAASSGHKAMVERLLQHGAKKTHDAGPDVEDSVLLLLRSRGSYSPLWAALLRLDNELKKGVLFPPEGPQGAWLRSTSIQNTEKIIALLSENNDDDLAKQAIAQLQNTKSTLVHKFQAAQIEQRTLRKSLHASNFQLPIDLGILSKSGGERDTEKIKEICAGPEVDWRMEEIDRFIKNLKV